MSIPQNVHFGSPELRQHVTTSFTAPARANSFGNLTGQEARVFQFLQLDRGQCVFVHSLMSSHLTPNPLKGKTTMG